MPVSIKRKNPTINHINFDLEKLVTECIENLILNRLQLRRTIMLKRVEYFSTYTLCKQTNEKTLSSFFLRLKNSGKFTEIRSKEIELSGASIVEFVDYLNTKGVKEISNIGNYLETI